MKIRVIFAKIKKCYHFSAEFYQLGRNFAKQLCHTDDERRSERERVPTRKTGGRLIVKQNIDHNKSFRFLRMSNKFVFR